MSIDELVFNSLKCYNQGTVLKCYKIGLGGVFLDAKKKSVLSEFGLLLVTVIWGSGFVVVKSATGSLEPAAIVALRFGIAAVLMCVIFFKKLKEIDKGCVKAGILSGFLYYIAFYLQTLGAKYTTAGKNAFLTAIYVVLVPFLYWVVKKQKPDGYNVSAAVICMVGIGFLSLNADFSINTGDAFSLLGGIGFTAQIVAAAILTQKHNPILLSITQFIFAAVFAGVTSLVIEPIPTSISQDSINFILYLGVFSTMIALLLQTVCQKYVPASKASLIMSLESVFGCLCGAIFLHEQLTPRILVGFVLIFAAILLSEVKPSFLKFGSKKAASTTLEDEEGVSV